MRSSPRFTVLCVSCAAALCVGVALAQQQPQQQQQRQQQQPNPQMQKVLDALAALHPKPIETLDAKEARQQPAPADAVKKMLEAEGKSTAPQPDVNTDDRKIDGPKEKIPVRVYTPKSDAPQSGWPALVYFHGGGWVIATIDTYDSSCRALCDMAQCVVVSVEYRKAPENKYPAAVDDAFAAYQWVCKNAKDIKVDAGKIAVGGESAGGNLATVTAMNAKEKGAAMPVFQLLVYPVINNDFNTPSYQINADAKPLSKAAMVWFFDKYLADKASGADPHVCPIKATDAQLNGLPPALVITDSIDPLMSEGKQYADKLSAAGVSVQYKNYDGVTHEFFGMGAVVDTAKQAETDAANALKEAFTKGGGERGAVPAAEKKPAEK